MKRSREKRCTVLKNYGGTFTMPGEFKVSVYVTNTSEAKDQMGSKILAQYYQDEHLILLKRSRSDKQRKSDLEHELHHMCIDWIDHFVRKATINRKKKRKPYKG